MRGTMLGEGDRPPSRGLAAALVLVGFAVYLAMNHPALWNVYRHLAERGLRRSAVLLGYLAAGYVVFLALLLSMRRAGAAVLLVAVAVSVFVNFVHSLIFHGWVLSGEMVEWLLAEYRQAPKFWIEFRPELAAALALTLLAVAALLLVRLAIRRAPRLAGLGRGPMVLVPALAFLAFQALPILRPVPFAVAESSLYAYGIQALLASSPEPRSPMVRPERAPLVDKIVLVVDESVTHSSYRSIIAPDLVGLPGLDYGEAASIANCSSQTNALLRWGVEKPAVGRAGYDPRATPHLWGYARAAGMRTTLVDGQSWGFPQNYLFPGELRQLDEFVPALQGPETDRALAALLNQRLRRPGRELVYAVKRGAHFPFPQACAPGVVPPRAPKPVQHAAAVACSADRFFELLARGVDFSRVLLVYTSDHGQDFENTRATHCNPRPRAVEYSVPLVVLTRAGSLEGPLRAGLPAMRGRASHANIFPTLLHAMGYPRAWTETLYGPTLAGPPAGYLTLRGSPFPSRRDGIVPFSNGSAFPGLEVAATASRGDR